MSERGFTSMEVLAILNDTPMPEGSQYVRQESVVERRCPTCGGPYDPVSKFAEMQRLGAEFIAAYPRVYCPSCRKRLSPGSDSINAGIDDGDGLVHMVCHHCDHRFDLSRSSGEVGNQK